jgi:ABC-type multidrug transport system permease subunit
MYAPGLAAAAALAAEAPWVLAAATLEALIVAPLVSLPGDPLRALGGAFATFWAALALCGLCYAALAHAVAAASPSLAVAHGAGFLAQAALLLFGGLLVPFPSVPRGWEWLMRASPLFHASNAVWAAVFACDAAAAAGCRTFVQLPVPAPIMEWTFIEGWLGLQGVAPAASLLNLLPILAAYAAAAVAAAQALRHVQR